jgi:hypothetical protein
MRKRIGALTFILIGLSALIGSAQAKDCEFWPIFLIPHGTAESRFTVKSGKAFTIFFGGGGTTAVSQTKITQNPTSGKVTVNGHRVLYQTKPGFTGNDEFTYAREGVDETGKPSPMAVHLRVTVVPDDQLR